MTVAPTLHVAPRRGMRWALIAFPLAFIGLYFAWPTASLAWRAAFGEDLAEGASTLTGERLARVITTTVGLAGAGTAVALVIGLPAAWALFRLRWRGQRAWRVCLSVPFALPTVVVAAAFLSLVRRGGPLGFLDLDGSLVVISVALAFFNIAVVLRVVGGTWAGLDPRPALAARTLGASRLRAFRHVTLPTLAPAIAAAAAIVFLFCSTSFAIVLVLGGTRVSTVETEIWIQINQFLDLRAAAALALVQVATVAVALTAAGWARRRLERSLPRRSLDGSRPVRRADLPWITAALAPAVLVVLGPGVGLIHRALWGRDGFTLEYIAALAGDTRGGALTVPLWRAAVNSLEAAAVATAVALVCGLIVTWALTHPRRRWLDAVVMLPLGVSSVVVGVGILLTLARTDLGAATEPRFMIPAAQAIVALPLVVRALSPIARSIDPHLREAAATLGAGPWRIWREVDWPALRRPLGLAAGLAAAVSLGEFGATTFLARPDHPTLPTAIYRLLSRPGPENLGTAFAACLALAAVTAIVMAVAERWRTPGRSEL